MRLRLVYEGSFAKNEVTLFEEAMRKNRELELTSSDCIMLVSKSGKMLKFVRKAAEVSRINGQGKNGKSTTVVFSETYRITGGGKWNPLMLANYAKAVGVELEGLKRFEQHYRHLQLSAAE